MPSSIFFLKKLIFLAEGDSSTDIFSSSAFSFFTDTDVSGVVGYGINMGETMVDVTELDDVEDEVNENDGLDDVVIAEKHIKLSQKRISAL